MRLPSAPYVHSSVLQQLFTLTLSGQVLIEPFCGIEHSASHQMAWENVSVLPERQGVFIGKPAPVPEAIV